MTNTAKRPLFLSPAARIYRLHTVVELLDQGYGVIIIDNFSNSKPEVLCRIREITGKGFLFYQKDLLDKAGLEEIFEKHRMDAVIHFPA